jgi:hypothetical protein
MTRSCNRSARHNLPGPETSQHRTVEAIQVKNSQKSLGKVTFIDFSPVPELGRSKNHPDPCLTQTVNCN